MQERSELWKTLAASDSSRLETAAEIDGVVYTSISAPIISRNLMTEPLSVGNASSASLQFSVLSDNSIPESAEVKIKMRFSDGSRYSEWLPAGTFFVANRKEDGVVRKLTSFTCFDALRKAEETDWTDTFWDYADRKIPMREIINDVANSIEVEVDDRTWEHIRDGPDYVCELPKLIETFTPFIEGDTEGIEVRQYLRNKGATKRKVLGYIGACMGGNWHITPENKLRFVPILNSPDAESAEDPLNVIAITGSIKTGKRVTISGVSISDGQKTFTAGTKSGYVLTIPRNPYASQTIANDLFDKFGNLAYAPYSIEKGLYDPAAELGDYVVSRNDVRSVLYAETARLNLAFRGDISAPFREELTNEYPYRSKTEELGDELQELVTVVADKASVDDLYALRAQIENLSVSDIKTGIIHSNDYQYAPYPRVYPSKALFPSATRFPSNGEYVLRGFAIDFSTGTIRGAFYSEQIIALQEIASAHAARLETLGGRLDDLESLIDAANQKAAAQEGQISALQTGVSGLNDTVSTHGTDIDNLKRDVAALRTEMQTATIDLTAAIAAVRTALVYPRSPRSS